MLSLTACPLRSCPDDTNPSQSNLLLVSRRAFTLVELVTVIAIIGILAAISFGVFKGVQERSAIGQARAELGAISQALESYKRLYGDYPRTGDNAAMLQSLIGKKAPNGGAIDGKIFIEVAKLGLSSTTSSPFTTPSITVIDPWGRDYIYAYKTSASWINPSFVLLSSGPDGFTYGTTPAENGLGALIDAAKGILNSAASTDSGAADNIYANK